MIKSDGTIPSRSLGLPVREVCVQVIAGPDTGTQVMTRDDVLSIGSAAGNLLVLTDPTVSGFHAELRRDGDRIRLIDHDSTNGVRIGPVLVENGRVTVSVGTVIQLGNTQIQVSEGQTFLERPDPLTSFGALRGRSKAMQAVMRRGQQVAASHVPVLVVGESGTGKELLSRALHESGARSSGPFVTVDCAAITGELFASELFGHEKGAFTGAIRRHVGAFERAKGGTIFLDEIGELQPKEQASLLGVLERKRFTRVGGSSEVDVDARVVAATNRDLRADVNRGLFRLDLYYRLAVVLVEIPPLRDRPDDLEVLIERLAHEEGYEGEATMIFTPDDLARLSLHRFPGNVRELRNMVAAAIATGEAPLADALTRVEDVGVAVAMPAGILELTYKDAKRIITQQFEGAYLRRLLERSDGSFRKGARIASINRSYLLELLDRHGLRR